ncbi:MAG: hypothetical protein M3Q65_15815 [Chloroflexota bacterium]|nr:hypothetical protein [Chloroflexota bacterium]
MTGHRPSDSLPLEVRQQLWARLWREVLLRPCHPAVPAEEARHGAPSTGATDSDAAS